MNSTDKSRSRFSLGPGLLVTAAFIGPGTVLTASMAGARFGYALVWAVLFSVVATIVLQEMAARLGIVSGKGLAESIQSGVPNWFARWCVLILVLGGILFGNCAYQTGNILGAAVGMEILTVGEDGAVAVSPADRPAKEPSQASLLMGKNLWAVVIAVVALAIIWLGSIDLLKYSLMFLVGLMAVLFLVSAIACGPDLVAILKGVVPSIPTSEAAGNSSLWFVIGLIGTTVVPYNLFLHASGAADRWGGQDVVKSVRHSLRDTVVSVLIGGVITVSLLITAAVTFGDGTSLSNVQDIARQLRPSLGSWAEFVFAAGLFAAGLSSSVTAPVAAAFATAGCFGWNPSMANPKLKAVSTLVIVVGLTLALVLGGGSKEAILVAQIANGLLLPVIAGFLLYMVNRRSVMKGMTNGWLSNLLGGAIVLVTAIIAVRQFNSVWTKITEMFAG